MDYLNVFLKLVIGVVYAVAVMKISGKSNLAPMSPIDQIQNYILGGIIGGVLYSRSITVLDFVFVMTSWAVISLSVNFLRKKNNWFRKTLDGSTITVIEDGAIVRSGVEKAKINLSDLYLKLRLQGIVDIQSIFHAQLEQNGQLVVITKEESQKFPILLVVDKVIYTENLKQIGKDESYIEEIMNQHKIASLDDIATIEYYEEKVRIIDFC
ncbi:DUF421 domain-containing protein [Erysipelothrix inopinata]|uniref:DUF421 domain-containing protein n=1 Tax=Erysipelothrix inopinata TaxID=225084 RepID=A0A7G9RY28_9FIRM|nr:YetF domain-containing protein [Erysipelothrix inopinata]QNN60503.1 DUF421 domain-containing protein [Erysipelothrix inopinata]